MARRSMQDFESMLLYAPHSMWQTLLSPDVPGQCKMDAIVSLLIGLGCRTPSEPTVKVAASWWMVVSEPPAEMAALSRASKTMLFKHMKSAIHKARLHAPSPPVHIQALPSSPHEYKERYSEMWDAYYMQKIPAAPPGQTCRHTPNPKRLWKSVHAWFFMSVHEKIMSVHEKMFFLCHYQIQSDCGSRCMHGFFYVGACMVFMSVHEKKQKIETMSLLNFF